MCPARELERGDALGQGEAVGGTDLVIVDDDAMFTILLKRLLRRAEIGYLIFEDASEALKHLRRTMPRSLLVDLRMPGLDGVQLLDTLAQGSAPLPPNTFVCSSCRPPADTCEAIEALGARLILKDELLIEGTLPALTGRT